MILMERMVPGETETIKVGALPRMITEPELVSYEPATGAELWRGPMGDVNELVDTARRAAPAWALHPLSTRMELLRRFANEVRKEADLLATTIAREIGKPLWEAHAEVEAVIAKVEFSIRGYADRSSQRKLNSALQGTMALRHKPHGVIAVLGPFNHPAHLANTHIVPALIAGNAVIFKPSEKAPATGELLARCYHRAGIPASVLQVCFGGPDEGSALVGHDGVDGVLCTGSSSSGIAIHRQLAGRPDKLLALNMGGNNPIIVWDTPKLTDAAAIVVQSAFASAGQRCTAARRVIVKASLYDHLIAEVSTLADRLIYGAPFDTPAPFMGPVIDNASATGLCESYAFLEAQGGQAIKPLERLYPTLPFLSPAIIDVTNVAQRPDVELFGPILQVTTSHDFDEAIAEANATRFGLAASLVGGTPQEYSHFWANIKAGIVNWNRPTIGPTHAAPVGGVGLSGNHRAGGFYAADYCAYPVASGEVEQPRAAIGVGLR